MTHRALLHVQDAGKLYPGAWRQFDGFRQDRGGNLPAWPEYVYCPLAAAYAIVSGGGSNRVPPHMAGDVGRLGALASWRPTQGIYRYDETLFSELVSSPLTGALPCELLRRLPAWCVYIETPGLSVPSGELYGFFAHLEWDPNDRREELRLLLDSEEGLLPVPLHLGPWDLVTALDEAGREARKWAVEIGAPAPGNVGEQAPHFAPLLSLLLYLCADQADYMRQPLPRPKRTKQGWRLFPAKRPSTWGVGERLGAALRRAYQSEGNALSTGGHVSPRGHVRAAHWHTYVKGPRDGEQKRILKWLPPIPVNLDEADFPATIRPVGTRVGSD